MIRKIVLSISTIIFLTCSFAFCQEQKALPKLIVFHSPSCHTCIETKRTLMPAIEKEYKGSIEIEYLDIDDIANYKFLLSLKEKYKSDVKIELPVFFFEGKFLNSKKGIKNNLRNIIAQELFYPEGAGELPKTDLVAYFKSFTPLAISGAGLIDGINPCAFTVIVFFISFLALQGYKKRELLVIGLSFIFAVFLTYILIGLGLFGFLYRLKGFWLITKVLNLSIGVFSIVLGVICVYDFLKFKATGETEGLVLQLPQSIKKQIHKVIGMHYRKTSEGEAPLGNNIFKLMLSAFITGFLVSILEAVCTGQTYLPTISFILKTSHLKLQALNYLLLYNFMFTVPLLIIFIFALLGVTTGQFSSFLKKHMLTIKILMATLFFVLGLFLLWRA